MFDLKTIPEFQNQRSSTKLHEYVKGDRIFPPDHAAQAIKVCNLYFYKDFHIHPGALFECCEYLGLPYPRETVKITQKECIRGVQKHGAWVRCHEVKESGGCHLSRLADLTKWRMSVKEQMLEIVINFSMKADNSKLESARLRSVWGILLWEMKLNRAFLAGYNYPKIFE